MKWVLALALVMQSTVTTIPHTIPVGFCYSFCLSVPFIYIPQYLSLVVPIIELASLLYWRAVLFFSPPHFLDPLPCAELAVQIVRHTDTDDVFPLLIPCLSPIHAAWS